MPRLLVLLTAVSMHLSLLLSGAALLSGGAFGIEVDLQPTRIQVHEFRDGECTSGAAVDRRPLCFLLTVDRVSGDTAATSIIVEITYDVRPPQLTESWVVTFRGEDDGTSTFELLPEAIRYGYGVAEIRVSIRLASSADVDPDPDNNTLSDIFIVEPQPPPPPRFPDLTIGSLSIGPRQEWEPGERFQLAFYVSNQGDADAGSFSVRVVESDDTAASPDDRPITNLTFASLRRGAKEKVDLSVPAHENPGTRHVVVVLDEDDVVEERNETNNGTWKRYLVSTSRGIVQFTTEGIVVEEDTWRTTKIFVQRTQGGIGEIVVEATVEDATASSDDYTYPFPDVIRFRAGFRETLSFWFRPKNDATYEGDEQITFRLIHPLPDESVLGPQATYHVTITDDGDHPGTVGFDAQQVEVDEFVPTFQLPVRRSAPRNGTARLHYRTVEGTAREGVDYLPVTGDMCFCFGNAVRFIPIRILYDPATQGSRQFSVELSNVQGVTPGDNMTTVIEITETGFSVDQSNASMEQTFAVDDGVAQEFRPGLPLLDVAELLVSPDSTGSTAVPPSVWIELRADSLTGTLLAASTPVPLPTTGPEVVRFPFPRTEFPEATRYLLVLRGTAPGYRIHGGEEAYAGGSAVLAGTPRADVDLWFRVGQFARVGVDAGSWSDVKSLYRGRR